MSPSYLHPIKAQDDMSIMSNEWRKMAMGGALSFKCAGVKFYSILSLSMVYWITEKLPYTSRGKDDYDRAHEV